MQFSGDSWVDIGGPDGATVEKALIKSGESRSFTPGQVTRVTLGNASAVQVQQNGAIVDLTPYQRANVARFQLAAEEWRQHPWWRGHRHRCHRRLAVVPEGSGRQAGLGQCRVPEGAARPAAEQARRCLQGSEGA
ncbi:hypothetical protein G6F65_020653 [Rhizopus arrhizus]|nr:hypothetical protein G6F65_020653 [Rhizopus arrhizus]